MGFYGGQKVMQFECFFILGLLCLSLADCVFSSQRILSFLTAGSQAARTVAPQGSFLGLGDRLLHAVPCAFWRE